MNSVLGYVVPLAMFLWYRLKNVAKVWISNPSMGSLIDTLYQSKLYFSSLKNCLCTFHKCDETAHHKNMVKNEQMVMMRWVDENDNS